MLRVETSIDIAAPPERVFEVVMDPQRLKDWVTIHRKVGKVSDTPLKEGATLEQTLCLAHTNFHVNWEVTEVQEPRLVVWEGKGPVRARTHHLPARARWERRHALRLRERLQAAHGPARQRGGEDAGGRCVEA